MPDFMMPKSKVAAEITSFVREALSPSDAEHAGLHHAFASRKSFFCPLE